ncbi:S-adenosyl-L-methionine-dependent methyltransferase [Plenodomus tracheiphilus IPT5]|uniref:S-adenosyl-L-methionine-dependent methyltransferase n=1 Tax=Plenodomus tracheiphilus IPT5 TaxID=1408161 RepID=A0A6A7B6V5_9PLEO|nr:S-adenosyl-L-methionine-dependent methyltransferase [Plenodomus tracheiphilus IPT5]
MSADTERVDILGRTFQRISIDDSIYFAPVALDDREEERLTAQHDIFSRLLGDSMVSRKIPLADPRRVLDCGYGGGDWCVQFAEEYEDSEVTGVDIFPLRVADQPENLTLCGYNLNDRLRDPDVFQARAYDLVHSRFLCSGIKRNRWPSYIGDIKLLLRPGGWLQMAEYYPLIQSDSGRLTEQAAVRRWWSAYESSMHRLNRDPRIGRKLQQLMTEKGFRDVKVDIERLPIGAWQLDPVKSSIGRDAVMMIADLLESLGLWPFTANLGWTAAQYDQLMEEIRMELQNTELKLYMDM